MKKNTSKKNVDNTRICLSTLKARGWTEKLISKFAPEPMYAPNPHYKCAHEMKLFYLKDIERIEKYKRFQAELGKNTEKIERRKFLEETRGERCQAELKKRLDSAFVHHVPENELKKLAMESKLKYFKGRHNSCLWAYYNVPWVNRSTLPNPYYFDDYEGYCASSDFMAETAKAYVYGGAPEEEIMRWMVDYILFYELKFGKSDKLNYGTLRDEIAGKRIPREYRKKLMDLLNIRAYSLIEEAYPFLQGACNDQLKFKGVASAA